MNHTEFNQPIHPTQPTQTMVFVQPYWASKSAHLLSKLALTLLIGLTVPGTSVAQTPTQAGASQSSPSRAQAPQNDADYILGPGDRVRIDFFSVPEYSGEYQVLPNSTINLPQVGAVSVQNRTLKQASDAIAVKYEPYLTRPIITVSLLAARPITIAIAGEISKPGTYTVPAVSTTGDSGVPTVTRLIQLAGGITQAANVDQVQVRRPRSLGQGDETINVNLGDLVKTGNLRQDLRLRDGDSIFIPSTTTANLTEAQRLARVSFAAKTDRPLKIAIVGEVNRPGPYTLADRQEGQTSTGIATDTSGPNQPIPTVTRAIQTAGGITQSADIRNIQVRRVTQAGPEQVIKVDFWQLLQGGDLRQDLPLQDGDTIVIPTATTLSAVEATKLAAASFSPDKITVNVVGEVTRPGQIQVPPNTPLNQALLAAGGFNNRARKRSVTFVRLNPNGTVARRTVDVDFDNGLNEKNNPALRNNDTIVVGKSGLAQFSDTLGSVLSPLSGIFGFFRILGF